MKISSNLGETLRGPSDERVPIAPPTRGAGRHVTKFRAGKRIKAAHRRFRDDLRSTRMSLRDFARTVADPRHTDIIGVPVGTQRAAGQWLLSKRAA